MARNVVLLCLDTVRHDYFEQYGDDLQAVADHSFEECRTASTWSVPSHASMFTEVLPHRHGFHSATPAFDELSREETFLSDLDGFRLAGVSANPYASPIFGFDGLFDEFHHIESSMPYSEGLSPAKFWHESSLEGWTRYLDFAKSCALHGHPVKSLANGVASQAEKVFERLPVAKPFDDGCKRILSRTNRILDEAEEPTFVFANVMDAHGPLMNVRGYDQSLIAKEHRNRAPDIDALTMTLDETWDDHADDIEAYRDLYAAAVDYTTRQVAAFCERVPDDTAVVVTSDHGEQLDDTGVDGDRRFGHVTPDVTEELLHVPLVVVNGDLSVDDSEPVSHLDLGNLIASLVTEISFEKRRPLAAEVAGLGVAHPPTDREDIDYWSRVSRCCYLDGVETKYTWDSLGAACRYERSGGEYVLEREGGPDIVPAAATEPFDVDIGDVRTDTHTGEVDAAVESQLEGLGYL